MKKVMILIIVLLIGMSAFVKNDTKKIPAANKETIKKVRILVNDKMINRIINEISSYPKTIDIMFNNPEQEDGYKVSENLKNTIGMYDAYMYNSKASEPFAKDIIDSAGNKLNDVYITRGGGDLKSSQYLPFYYLNGDNLKIAILNVKNALQDLDAKNRDTYEENYNEYIKLINYYLNYGRNLGKSLNNYIFVYPDDRYKSYLDYNNLKSKAVKDYKNSDDKRGVFIYSEDKQLQDYDMFIEINHLDTMKISFPSNEDIIDSLRGNINYLLYYNGYNVLKGE